MSRLRQGFRFLTDPFTLLSDVRRTKGDLFVLMVPGVGRVAFVCSARLMNDLYRKAEEEVVAGEARARLVGDLTGSAASVSIDGDAYVARRQSMAPYFSAKHLQRHFGILGDFARDMIGRWPRDRPFRLQPYFNEITLKTICRALFGPPENGLNGELAHLSGRFLDAFRSRVVQTPCLRWNLGRRSPWGRFLAVRRDLERALDRELQGRAADPRADADDLVSGLLENGAAGKVIFHEVLSMLVGGAETTWSVLSWTVRGVLADRLVHERLCAEVRGVLGGDPIDASHLPDLPYLDAVIWEGMRYRAFAPFAAPRLAKQDFELGGYRVAAGTLLVQCLSEIGRDRAVFPHPDRFEPRNFFGRDVRMKDWVPFGGGSRICTGMALARTELTAVVATIFQNVDLELQDASAKAVQRGMTFLPADDLRVRVIRSS